MKCAAEMPMIETGRTPEVYVDAFHGVAFAGGVMKVNLVSFMPGADGAAEKRLVLRLAATVPNLRDMIATLGRLLDGLDKLEATHERTD